MFQLSYFDSKRTAFPTDRRATVSSCDVVERTLFVRFRGFGADAGNNVEEGTFSGKKGKPTGYWNYYFCKDPNVAGLVLIKSTLFRNADNNNAYCQYPSALSTIPHDGIWYLERLQNVERAD